MPFTPFHFGPHAVVALPLNRWIDVPVFIGVNVAVDIEPLLVIVCNRELFFLPALAIYVFFVLSRIAKWD